MSTELFGFKYDRTDDNGESLFRLHEYRCDADEALFICNHFTETCLWPNDDMAEEAKEAGFNELSEYLSKMKTCAINIY